MSLVKRTLGWATLALVVFVTHAAAEDDGMQEAAVFVSGEDGYHTFRIPAMVVAQSGALLAFCEGRKHGGGDAGEIALVLRRSMDGGETWGPLTVVAEEAGSTCGNPAPVVDVKTGTILLPFTKNKAEVSEPQILKGEAPPRSVWLTQSADDGLTWFTPVEISSQTRRPDWRWYATGPCHAIQLRNGRIVVPCDHSLSPDHEDWHSHVVFSDDGGATWEIGGVAEGYTNESTVLELADGSLYLNMRSYHGIGQRHVARSGDGGLTWSAPQPDSALVEPVCQASCLRVSAQPEDDKNRVLFSNPASRERVHMTVRLSYDECATWPVGKTLHSGPSAYSDLAVLPDGTLCCLYERGEKNPYETITLARFTLGWLTDGADPLTEGR